MKHVRDAAEQRERYVCRRCEGDPLHDEAARKWVDSPPKPSAET